MWRVDSVDPDPSQGAGVTVLVAEVTAEYVEDGAVVCRHTQRAALDPVTGAFTREGLMHFLARAERALAEARVRVLLLPAMTAGLDAALNGGQDA